MEIAPVAFNASQLLLAAVGESRRHTLAPSGSLRGGSVELIRLDSGVLVRASLTVAVDVDCSRCLAPLTTVAPIEFDEVYEQRYDPGTGVALDEDERDPEAFGIGRDHVIDITEGVRQYCEAAAPMQPLCSVDCQGLCPGCGIDRSVGDCACAAESSDPRWAALAALKKE